jgi:hypothetical protein
VKVIIKGRLADAILGARRHGLAFEFRNFTETETVGWVDARSMHYSVLLQCQLWFGEAPRSAPYPAGTLLWFGPEEEGKPREVFQ